jgi:hypothetical protein
MAGSAWGWWGALPPARMNPVEQDPSCLAGSASNRPYSRKLDAIYEVRLGPSAGNAEPSDACSATIVSRAGSEVFRISGFSVILDAQTTGQDIDGDGRGDVVLRSDSGGGQHCCWSVSVVSLYPQPRKLFDVEAVGLVRFTKDTRGRSVIWQRVPGPDAFTDAADRPFAERAFRVKGGKLVDATPEFCRQILASGNPDFEEWGRVLTPERLKSLGGSGGTPDQEVASALWSRILQNTFCLHFDEALDDLDHWPPSARADDALREIIKDDYPRFAARLRDRARPRTTNERKRTGHER